MDILSRLAWALPLVLLLGAALMLGLRRFVIKPRAGAAKQRMTLCESLMLSEETRVHLFELDGRAYLIAESTKQTVLQAAQVRGGEMVREPLRLAPPWMKRMYKAAAR